MKKRSKKSLKRLNRLISICAVFAMLLAASTYAWFIGMKTVNVNSFDINIATTEGLFLSMDGESWTYNLDVGTAKVYTGNTNSWATDGLIPVSTIGVLDKTSSRMNIYEKGSLTTTKGGYRLLASKVNNTGATEQKGYVAFDLFVKNISGEAYYPENNELNEEAIYLNTNSSVKVATTGGVNGTGIENSVRVAFAQIGRVTAADGVATTKNVTDISCSDIVAASGQAQVTGICRNATIWEPNDTKHVQNAINWYNTSCKTRKTSGTDVNAAGSYEATACATVNTVNTELTPTPTYAISRVLGVEDNIDVYDGRYNSYTANTATFDTYKTAIKGLVGDPLAAAQANYKLIEYPYFTDTMKNIAAKDRPQFMSLAPNSITKVRVYVYIEGQDIDNYDFASLGQKISVNFGFTKERYTEGDVGYTGPSTDITPTATN